MVRKITYLSIYFAIVLLLSLVPNLGYISLGDISITFAPIIIIIGCYHLEKLGASIGFMIGLGSFIAALVFGRILFVFPDISIISRLLLGIIVYLIIKVLGKPKLWKTAIIGMATPLLNTFLVSAFILIHNEISDLNIGLTVKGWLTLIWINATAEFIFITIATLLLHPFLVYLYNQKPFTSKNYLMY
ncbi:hypothetical protein VO56_02785 [Mycoplasmopsis gallinacea]|uniref:ECF transporter S component n=1 Tax=Mycoplasmopsis gallinacea TaxID=29556 RepID=A0A0D5ZJR5_9BACT|nr:hypothetical protein VO56_02785 [Mycoplasmopsis gallinacea]